jgi:hypothetical protein
MKTKLSSEHAFLSLSLKPSPKFGLMLVIDDLPLTLREEVSHRFQVWEEEALQELELTFYEQVAILEQSWNDSFCKRIS